MIIDYVEVLPDRRNLSKAYVNDFVICRIALGDPETGGFSFVGRQADKHNYVSTRLSANDHFI
jgi:hypothetical protein